MEEEVAAVDVEVVAGWEVEDWAELVEVRMIPGLAVVVKDFEVVVMER